MELELEGTFTCKEGSLVELILPAHFQTPAAGTRTVVQARAPSACRKQTEDKPKIEQRR
jgi:hypothetical protein